MLRFLYDRKYLHGIAMSFIMRDPAFVSHHPQSIRNAVSKLAKKEFIRSGADGIMLRPNGREYVERRMSRLHYFESPFSKSTPKNLLILFDIPEDRKAAREWFRKQLREFGYEMIQKSVWLGPSPLPKEFVQYVKGIGLKDCIKTFKLAHGQRNDLEK
ncbi:MAG TPA: CRISPR-associated endonuclease Cas2 [Candidatus Paceibacterota bacterium]|nr:CRISPR-associated endonuclease Cas2 [Candidatus Paceibacterota bacterium]